MSWIPAQIEALAMVWLSVLGLVVGSFLNVVIARLPHGQSVVTPRSRCPGCGHQIAWYENIPVISWLALRGRCRACRATISVRYLLVEVLTAALFLACLRRFGWSYELLPALLLVTVLIPLTFIDLEHWLLPFALTIPGIFIGLALSVPMGLDRLRDAVIGAIAGFFGFWLLELVGEKVFKKEALGGGDKFLLALIGAFLTWRALLGVVFLASFQGALIGSVLLLARGRAGPAATELPVRPGDASDGEDDWTPGPTSIPFGPWLSLAALELMLLGPWLSEVLPTGISWVASGRISV